MIKVITLVKVWNDFVRGHGSFAGPCVQL